MTKARYTVEIEYDADNGTEELDSLVREAMWGINESLPTTRELHIRAWHVGTRRQAEKLWLVSEIDFDPKDYE